MKKIENLFHKNKIIGLMIASIIVISLIIVIAFKENNRQDLNKDNTFVEEVHPIRIDYENLENAEIIKERLKNNLTI